MLAHQTQKNLSNAQEYFRQHLQVGDYYSGGQQIRGEWHGESARRLGLNGPVDEEQFVRLCNNQHPATGQRLTARMKLGTRRIFEDFVFSPPKSVSIAALIVGDENILAAHRAAVAEALAEVEQLAGCRVRIGKSADGDRHTGNIVAACFEHDSSRVLDPQLHTHCIAFNATWDEVEKRWNSARRKRINSLQSDHPLAGSSQATSARHRTLLNGALSICWSANRSFGNRNSLLRLWRTIADR
jgi:conjugative relaxase-like TrwC/TraI family protein